MIILAVVCVAAVVLAGIALEKHITIAEMKSAVAKAHAELSASLSKQEAGAKADVASVLADLKKWI